MITLYETNFNNFFITKHFKFPLHFSVPKNVSYQQSQCQRQKLPPKQPNNVVVEKRNV